MLWTCCPKCRPCLWLTAPCLTEACGPSSRTCRPTPNMNVASSSESKVKNKPPLYIPDSVLSYAWSKNWTRCFISSPRSGLCHISTRLRPPPPAEDARAEGENVSWFHRDDRGHRHHPLQGQEQGETEAEDARRAQRRDAFSQKELHQE